MSSTPAAIAAFRVSLRTETFLNLPLESTLGKISICKHKYHFSFFFKNGSSLRLLSFSWNKLHLMHVSMTVVLNSVSGGPRHNLGASRFTSEQMRFALMKVILAYQLLAKWFSPCLWLATTFWPKCLYIYRLWGTISLRLNIIKCNLTDVHLWKLLMSLVLVISINKKRPL